MAGAGKTVTVRISRDGKNVKVDADGFSGEGCIEATKNFIATLGTQMSTEHKNEFYAAEAQALKETC